MATAYVIVHDPRTAPARGWGASLPPLIPPFHPRPITYTSLPIMLLSLPAPRLILSQLAHEGIASIRYPTLAGDLYSAAWLLL